MASRFFAFELDGEWSPSHPCHFTCWEIARGTNWIKGPVDPRVGLDASDGNRTSDFQPIAIPTELSRLVMCSIWFSQ
jgi:hypothetical protein